jgi:hypothetical protein
MTGLTRWQTLLLCGAVTGLWGCQGAAPGATPREAASSQQQALSTWPTSGQWVALTRGGTALADPNGDSSGAAGSSRDLEGSEVSPSVYAASNAAQVFFRVRLGASPAAGSTLTSRAWGCLLDTDGRANTWEYLVAVDGTTAGGQVVFSKNTATATLDAPTDPAETQLSAYSALTDNVVGTTLAHARTVSAGTAFGGGSDTFLDFAVDQADLQAAGVTAATSVRVLCGSSSTASALDDDLVGTGSSLSALLSDAVSFGISGATAYTSPCPAGVACFYMPAMLPAPGTAADGYAQLGGGDMVFASPTGASTVTYRYGAGPGTSSLSVASGGKQIVQLTGGSNGFATGYGVAEQRGVFATSTQRDLLAEQRYTPTYWQSSSTIKADTVALGTRFRVAGYSLDNSGGDGSGWDYLSFYAPWTTTITVTAPNSAPTNIWNGSSRTVTLNLTAGQTYILKSLAGSAYDGTATHGRAPEIDGTLVTSTAPISVVVGGMGWGYTPAGAGCAGDTGADGVVPVKYLGTDYVVTKFTATGEEDVRVVADTDGTQVSLNGTVMATINAGGTYKFVPTGVTNITATAPVAVFENTSYINCEADIGFIPPIAFASQANVPSMTVSLNSKGPGTLLVVVPAAQKSTVKVDGSAAGGVESTVPGRADVTTLKFGINTGDHVVTANSDLQVMLVAQDPGGGTGYVGYYSPYRRPGVGNGVLDGTESCDDGNVVDGDGCSSVGEVEAGFACTQNAQGLSVCGCATDTACPSGQYCAAGTPNTCVATLGTGVALPSQHGTCTAPGPLGGASTVCSSGLCNATTNTCGGAAGAACTTAPQCSTNSCVSNACADTVVLNVSPGTAQYVGGGAATPVDPGVTVTGTSAISGAGMTLGSGFVAGQDVLNYATLGTIVGSYDGTKGVLTLSGTGTLAQYQTALRSVTYSNSSGSPTPGTRVVSISLGTGLSNATNGHFYEYVSYNATWANANTNAATRSYLGLKGYLATITSQSENDFITAKLGSDGWIGTQASSYSLGRTWSWVGGPEAGTAFCTNVSWGSCVAIGTHYENWASGQPDNYGTGEACGEIYIANAGQWNDLPCTSNTLAGYVVEYGGSAGDPTISVSGTRNVNVSYVATGVTTTGTTLSYTQGAAATVVDPGVTVVGTATITSATVTLSAGYVSAEDTLAFPAANGLTGSYSAGVLTISGTGTTADYQAALRTVTYVNGVAPRPTTAPRTVRFTVGGVSATRGLQVISQPLLTLSSSAATSTFGSQVTFTATMTPLASTGTVQFFADGNSLGTSSLSSGVASIATSSLTVGGHSITASYSGDAQRLTATGSLSQTVQTLAAGVGPCTAGTAATVCTSGLCNTTTGTCASSNGGGCSAANQCVSNTCGVNGQCGLANGQSGCTAGTASLCQSGACSTNGTCMPAGGCAVTADCAVGQQCNVGSQACELAPDIQSSNGTTVYDALAADVAIDPALTVVGAQSITGATVTLGTGFVAAEDRLVFTNANGITGTYDSSKGVLTLTGTASTAAYQAALRSVLYRNVAGALPTTALRTATFGLGVAVASAANGHFYEYVSYSANWVNAKAAAEARTYLGLKGYLATITSQAENDFITTKLGSDGWIGAQANGYSLGRTWSWVGGPEAGQVFCTNNSWSNCTANGAAYENWNPGEPNNSGGGEACGEIYIAQAGRWNDLPCNGGSLGGYVVEYGGSTNDPVLTLNAQKSLQVRAATSMVVSSSQNPSTLLSPVTFTAHLTPTAVSGTVQFSVDGIAAGAPVALSGGVATSTANSALALGTHVITVDYAGDTTTQAVTGTLAGGQQVIALANGVGPCTQANAATVCSSGVCGSGGTCGYGTNEGPCTALTASVCQSGNCSLGGVCIPSGSSGCYVDGDCSGSSYCNRPTNTCVAKLASGAPIPLDGLHDGLCTAGNAASVCAGGACNALTDTCASDDGATCASAPQCASNQCSSGHCVPAGGHGCWADVDCGAGEFCAEGSLSCQAKLAAGAPIPNDGLHDGTCASSALVCASGACNATTATCAASDGAACTAQSQCTSNACSASGHCVPSAGACWADTDCGGAQYCSRSTFTCTAKQAAGTAIPGDGLHGGACSASSAAAVCTSGACNATTNTCAAGDGSSCSSGAECTHNTCSSGHCVPASGSGCWADADCGNGQYCNRSALTCAAKLTAGTALPSDGLHGGTCSTATASAVCATGVCNATANTCASANGATCSAAAQCTNNACSASGHCVATSGCWADTDCSGGQFCDRGSLTCQAKLAAGAAIPNDGLHNGLCSASTRAAVCSSGACNATTNTCGAADGVTCASAAECTNDTCSSGHCVPSASGCWADVDCGAGQYCNRGSLTCAAKLAAGVALPSDGLHDGTCSAGSGAALCTSGLCNATTDTCGAATGGSCQAASECMVNICQSGHCGIASGTAGCTPATASVCQSGHCSTAGTCVPSTPGACWVDADCAANKHCDQSQTLCVDDLLAGAPLPHDGAHDGVCSQALATAVCTTHACNAVTNTCADANTAHCTTAAQCVSGVCGSNGQCGHALGEGPCTAATATQVCQTGACNASANGSVSICVPATSGSCWVDADCSVDRYCARNAYTCALKVTDGQPLPGDGLHGACPASSVNAACTTGRCDAVTDTCAGGNGTACTADAECVSNVCGSNGKCGLADDQHGCTPATGAALCQSGACAASGVCTPGGGCWDDSDCTQAQFCDRDAHACDVRLLAGQALPSDGLHDGLCTAASGAALCASGVCNPTTNTCAEANGANCAVASACVSNVCGANGKCGLADGQTGCTDVVSASCQSGQCSTGGVCVPRTSGSCWIDGDCAAAQHCARDTFHCVDDGAAGTALGNDTLHTGVCSPEQAQLVCSTGECNPQQNTCAGEKGAPCTRAADCVINACGSDGKCGLADTESGCTPATAALCRSGACSSAGTCVPSEGCWVDADCAAGTYCHRSSTTCRPRESSGTPVPNDTLHDGVCTFETSKLTCDTGYCNALTNTCGGLNGDACTAADQCASNLCGADGKCGRVDGDTCTTKFECRGDCVNNTCVAATSQVKVATCATTSGGAMTWLAALGLLLALRRRASSPR